MRIVINGIPLLTPLSGVGRYVHATAEAMQRLSPEDQFFFFYHGYWSSHLKCQPSPSVQVARKMGRRFGSLYTLSRVALEGAFQLTHRFGRFDLYHETCFVPFHFKGPTVVTVLDLSFQHFPETHPPERLRFLRNFFYTRLGRAAHFITISQFVRNEMVKYLGLPPEKISVTYPGVDSVFHPRPSEELGLLLRERYGLEPGAYLFFVGNLEPRKNIPFLLQAYSRIPGPLRQKYPLVLAGGVGWMQAGLSDLIDRLGIRGDVKQVGYVPLSDLPILYAGATLFVYPSLYEGFGLPPVEAMASGCPVIVSHAGALPEVVGGAAALIDPLDSDNLTQVIQGILEDPGRRTRMSEDGLKKAVEYRWARCAQATLDVYHGVAKDNLR
jgi:glycosyltransferase involved in cell wall biosynthesis